MECDVSSTSGPVELAKIRCILKHWFLMPLLRLRLALTSVAGPTNGYE